MHVEVRNPEGHESVVIVDLDGRLVVGDGADLLREVVNELLAENWRRILLNLSNISALDSTGAGELVQSLKVTRSFGATMHLLRPQERVQRTLQITQLLPLFQIHEDEQAALEALSA